MVGSQNDLSELFAELTRAVSIISQAHVGTTNSSSCIFRDLTVFSSSPYTWLIDIPTVTIIITLVPSSAMHEHAASLTAWLAAWLWEM